MTQVIYTRYAWWFIGEPDISEMLHFISLEAVLGRQPEIEIQEWINCIETHQGFKYFSMEFTGNRNFIGNNEWVLIANFDTSDNALMAKLST